MALLKSLVALPLALLVPHVLAHPGAHNNAKAIYIITNDAANSVVALSVGRDGLLQGGSTLTSTGGAGSNGLDAMNQAASPDALFSQSALTSAGHTLFAVNAGSNTLTMFAVDTCNQTKLTMVGKPVALAGEFPVTVTASRKHKLVCVGMTGAKAGVSCAPFTHKGIGAMDALRPFDLKQTTPPVGPLNTVSQVFFSGDQSILFSTVKGDPTKNNTGFLAAFPVEAKASGKDASVAQKGTKSSPAGTAVLFGSSVSTRSSDIFVTDASFGGAVLSIDKTGAATTKGKSAIDGQKATCWSTINKATNSAFVTDVGANRLVEMSLNNATILSQIDLSANGDPGLIDLQSAGQFVYALSPGNGTTDASVTVVNAVTKKQVQHLSLKNAGASKNAMGLTLII